MLENLEKIKNAKVITSPFPHLVIDNFLREETVQNLHNELRDNLSKEKINKAGIFTKEVEKNSVKQFGAFDLNHEFLKNNESLKLSSRVNEFFGSFEFTDSLIKKLSPSLPIKYKSLISQPLFTLRIHMCCGSGCDFSIYFAFPSSFFV